MKIKVAAAAPEIWPGQPGQNMSNVLSCITRARNDGAAILVLPANIPEDLNRGAIERQAGSMEVYPITKPSLTVSELASPRKEKLDILCCSSDSQATASSYYENDELAAMASHDSKAVVVLACPKGGAGGRVFTGQCVIAQNGFLLQSSEDGYAFAEVSVPRRDVKPPLTETVSSQPIDPWVPLPEMLPRVLRLQSDALARRMRAEGATHLTLTVAEDASSMLALCACVGAVEQLKLSRKNIHANIAGLQAERIADRLGVSQDGSHSGLAVDTADLTARALEGASPRHYAVNATVPRSVARLVMRTYANTCGDRELSIPLRAIINADETLWTLYDFLLHFSLLYGFSKWDLARLLDDTFRAKHGSQAVQQVLDRFFDHYAYPGSCDGPVVFSIDAKNIS